IVVGGKARPLEGFSPHAAMEAGLALVPADRHRDGAVGGVSVMENMLLLVATDYYRRGYLSRRAMRQTAAERVAAFDIRPPDASLDFSVLSGGNQQKVMLAKWLEIDPDVVLLHEPTQGVDVGAREDIYRLLGRSVSAGKAALWVSTEFTELATVCDRVLVIAGGRVAEELSGPSLSKETISAAVYANAARAGEQLEELGG
ncbi:MAG: ATP-binding cassette domain-containing protein, partial [Acidimicrobiales bacterium]